MTMTRELEPVAATPVEATLAVPILDAEALTRLRDMFALHATNGTKYYSDVVEEKGEDSPFVQFLNRKANHHATFFAMMRAGREAGLPKAESLRQFKAYWYGAGPDHEALDAKAQEVYGVPYASLCCDRKRAVLAAVRTAEAAPALPTIEDKPATIAR